MPILKHPHPFDGEEEVPGGGVTLPPPRLLPTPWETPQPSPWDGEEPTSLLPVVTPLPAPAPPTTRKGQRWVLPVLLGAMIFFVAAIPVVTTLTHNSQQLRLVGGGTVTMPTVVSWHPTLRPDFQRGMVTPRWFPGAYGSGDTVWAHSLSDISTQTGASWVELPVLFNEPSGSLTITPVGPTPQALSQGIYYAHMQGYKVFVVPLLDITGKQGDTWSGHLSFPASSSSQQLGWFTSYWQAWQPYVQVAQAQHAEQLAIGSELSWLSYHAPASSWTNLLAETVALYTGHVTYNMNWTEVPTDSGHLPPWERDSRLYALGVSEYKPLTDSPTPVSPGAIAGLWKSEVQSMLDAVYQETKKPVLLSEVGYRNTSDALYQSWSPTSPTHAPRDPQVQEAVVEATIAGALGDSHVIGTFFWAWASLSDVGAFSLIGNPVLKTIQQWYTK